ncbi:FMN-dependent NADH-azoreductase [Lactiplantibacillus plantarum]|nr:NAD(P)H-dependent oxidoreductase [Lactiplantibacillus plantarum]QRQ96313.1 FMN-dependent NADH-azoreductase [Lactiplantibacillus plantarum]
MTKTLIINAHPDFRNAAHYSVQLEQTFLQLFQTRFPNDTVDVLNLYDTVIPQATVPELLGIWEKQAQHVNLSIEEQRLFAINQQLLQQFKAHHRIVIAMPLHNFNVPARLKDYIDNILVARETFRYTENGSVGLMTVIHPWNFLGCILTRCLLKLWGLTGLRSSVHKDCKRTGWRYHRH